MDNPEDSFLRHMAAYSRSVQRGADRLRARAHARNAKESFHQAISIGAEMGEDPDEIKRRMLGSARKMLSGKMGEKVREKQMTRKEWQHGVTQRGKRGGKFVITKSGAKVYVK